MSNGVSQLPVSTLPETRNPHVTSRKTHPTFHFLAGLTSGISTAVLLQPADLLKTRVQQSRSSSLLPTLRSILSGPNPVSALWRGTVPSALRTGFGSALYFTSLNTLRQLVANNAAKSPAAASTILANGNAARTAQGRGRSTSVLPQLSGPANLVTGATARVLAGLVLMPVTVIKVRYESDFYAYKSLASASRSIYTMEGLRGFFSGFGATAVRDAPYAGLYVVFYEWCKSRLSKGFVASASGSLTTGTATTGKDGTEAKQRAASASVSAGINATSGVIAAASATALTNPFDAVKTRLQLMPAKYGNMVKATRLMIHEDGFKSFFDGLGLRMGRKAISSALAWTVYEELIGRAERRLVDADNETGKAGL